MAGGRITGEERTTLSTYVGLGVIIVLSCAALYFFILDRKEKAETTTFDPNRPVATDAVLRERLTPEQFEIVRGNGSEVPFQNKYWNSTRVGLYVDITDGEPLFSSRDKYDADIGMPTFSKPISKDLLVEKPDNSDEMQRTELRARRSNARLGYLFPDSKSPTGQRYMIYSGALRFVPWQEMKKEGYGADMPLVRQP